MEKKTTEPMCYEACVRKLEQGERLDREQWRTLIDGYSQPRAADLARRAGVLRDRIYGKKVFVRGLIEFTNYCRNDCYYCGIRRSNRKVCRYRLTEGEILSCCRAGYALGFRTFVLQGGEDSYFTDERIVSIVQKIREEFPECAVTLSIGEKKKESYAAFREAGADRYLLRHETADADHYRQLHPPELTLENRITCLRELKRLGFQTGAGFMVGSPGQTTETLIDDMQFLEELQPEMVGIGPFIPHHDTPFREQAAGTLEQTLYLLSLVRLLLPQVLLPATTALGTIAPGGREAGILAGANVVMPNLSPENVREKYLLYDNKICTGKEAAECLEDLKASMAAIGYQVVIDRGDHISYQKERK
ncbi:MAG: [FeFe] hydrogenase H-cluster radical SAM maturase HydE [Lachnospiraceae bacterium]|nr:[FeFe] hydrogenase H-cluster radical SAM maturase HydE [Lachnospiraceae bacterium]